MRINSLEELACAALGDRFQANRIATTDGFWPRTTGQWIGAVRPAQVIRSSRKRRFICADGQSQLSVGTVAQTTMQGLVAPFVGLDLLPFCPSALRSAEPPNRAHRVGEDGRRHPARPRPRKDLAICVDLCLPCRHAPSKDRKGAALRHFGALRSAGLRFKRSVILPAGTTSRTVRNAADPILPMCELTSEYRPDRRCRQPWRGALAPAGKAQTVTSMARSPRCVERLPATQPDGWTP